jgi:hypothetical protein
VLILCCAGSDEVIRDSHQRRQQMKTQGKVSSGSQQWKSADEVIRRRDHGKSAEKAIRGIHQRELSGEVIR